MGIVFFLFWEGFNGFRDRYHSVQEFSSLRPCTHIHLAAFIECKQRQHNLVFICVLFPLVKCPPYRGNPEIGVICPERNIRATSRHMNMARPYECGGIDLPISWELLFCIMTSWTKSAQWIWAPKCHEEENRPGRYFLFRKSFHWRNRGDPHEFSVHVSADSRYRLFVNGQRVSFGPCKSYAEKWHYETVDILSYLVEGENVLSARVLRYSSLEAGSSSIISTELPGFMLYGKIEVSAGAT